MAEYISSIVENFIQFIFDNQACLLWSPKNSLATINVLVKFNLGKYLVDENGKLIDVFYSITEPLSDKIVKLL